jgi:hypothetical protein
MSNTCSHLRVLLHGDEEGVIVAGRPAYLMACNRRESFASAGVPKSELDVSPSSGSYLAVLGDTADGWGSICGGIRNAEGEASSSAALSCSPNNLMIKLRSSKEVLCVRRREEVSSLHGHAPQDFPIRSSPAAVRVSFSGSTLLPRALIKRMIPAMLSVNSLFDEFEP